MRYFSIISAISLAACAGNVRSPEVLGCYQVDGQPIFELAADNRLVMSGESIARYDFIDNENGVATLHVQPGLTFERIADRITPKAGGQVNNLLFTKSFASDVELVIPVGDGLDVALASRSGQRC